MDEGLRPETIRRILVPTDFRRPAKAALAHACDLARGLGAVVHLLHVIEAPQADRTRSLITPELVEKRRRPVRLRLEHEAASKVEHDVPIYSAVRTGDTASEILRYASELPVDLIIMGAQGRDASPRELGSVTQEVLRGAQCPVLTARGTHLPLVREISGEKRRKPPVCRAKVLATATSKRQQRP